MSDLSAAAPGIRVVFVRDRTWPPRPGVCCWRAGTEAAFADAGVSVTDLTIAPVGGAPSAERSSSAGHVSWLPSRVRAPIAKSKQRLRRTVQSARTTSRYVTDIRSRAALRARLSRATVIVAESVGVAEALLVAGVPAQGMWVLALPPGVAASTADDAYGRRIAQLAPVIGFIVDGQVARDTVERAASGSRPTVVILPPVATDWVCPTCGDVASADASELPPEVAQLAAMRRLTVDDDRSSPIAARRFPDAYERAVPPRAGWPTASGASWWLRPASGADGDGDHDEWTIARQRQGVRDVLAMLPDRGAPSRPVRSVVVSGYDLKFARELAVRLDKRPDLDVTLDDWPHISKGSAHTNAMVARADSIFAEWARPSAAMLAQRKRDDQTLIVRLHRYELDFPYPRGIDIDRVDAVVCVSRPVGRRIVDELGWPAEKIVYIPNFIDMPWLDRPKLPDARFGIGIVGVEWANKRFDLALDLLATVRRTDPRFSLFVRSVLPWDSRYAWARPDERDFATWCWERIERDPLLRGGVIFDAPGRDMARWYRRVGQVLSMSDIESFHLGAAEGMASGAVPVIRPWPGASEIYGTQWIFSSVGEAAAEILANADQARWTSRAKSATADIRRIADPDAVVAAWADLLHGDIAAARSYFDE